MLNKLGRHSLLLVPKGSPYAPAFTPGPQSAWKEVWLNALLPHTRESLLSYVGLETTPGSSGLAPPCWEAAPRGHELLMDDVKCLWPGPE